MRALILSAGFGERLRPITLKRAKPAIEVMNVPMLAYPYYWLDKLGLTHVAFNTHHLPDTVRHAAMSVVSPETQIQILFEPEILGSGGGIWNARFHLSREKNFAVANADALITFPDPETLSHMLDFHKRKGALATLLVCPLEGVATKYGGAWTKPDQRVIHFGKSAQFPEQHLECLHYASVMFLAERIWSHLPEGPSNILFDVLVPAMEKGEEVYGYRVDDMRWFETGNVSDYLASTKACLELISQGAAPGRSLTDIITRWAPDSMGSLSSLESLRLISDSSSIQDASGLRGFCVIGENATVERGAVLENCVVLPGAHVAAGTSHGNELIL